MPSTLVRPPRPPGPRSRVPGRIVWSLRTDTLNFLDRTARQFGDVAAFPVGPLDYFVLSHPDLVRDVLVTQAANFTKGPALRRAKITLGEGLLVSEGDVHRRQRRLMQPALHPRSVATYDAIVTRHTMRLANRWQDGQRLDLHHEMMELTLAVVSEALFGADLGAEEIERIGDAMDVSVRMFTRALLPFGMLLGRLPLPSNFRFKRALGRLDDTIARFVRERRAQAAGPNGSGGPPRNDLLSILLRARDAEGDGSGMSDRQLRDEAMTLFTAGHETTANALTFVWYLLAHHPHAEVELHAELERVLGGRVPTYTDVDQLPYTRAVFAEAMRLYPPAWAVGRQAIEPCRVGDRVDVPAGAVLLMSQWVLHRDERYWPDPLAFDPRRFLGEHPERPRYAYFPFGGGPRQCIGEAFAWTEGVLAIATLGQRWRLRLLEPDQPLPLQATITLRPRNGLPARIERRTAPLAPHSPSDRGHSTYSSR